MTLVWTMWQKKYLPETFSVETNFFMIILVTGSAGFIGSSLVERLLTTESPIHIVGLDNVNDYYDVSIKEYRLNRIEQIAARYPESTYTLLEATLL